MAKATTKRRTRRGTTTKGKPTAKQEEVKRLLEAGQSIVEIADLMETTPGAVKAQISRLRKLGVKVAPTDHGRSTEPQAPLAPEPERAPASEQSVEEHIASELAEADERVTVIETTVAALEGERTTLSERKGRLEAAQAELGEAGRSHLTAVA